MNPYQVVKDFERAVCEYTGAPYCVAVNSCTMALTLAVAYQLENMFVAAQKAGTPITSQPPIEIPKRTYVGVPYAIREAGGRPIFRDEVWRGMYRLKPLPVFDSARWFTAQMYMNGMYYATGMKDLMVCVSFQASKTLGDTQGGAVLLDDHAGYEWLRRARFDGRTERIPPNMDTFPLHRAWHCYMSNDVAARLLLKLHSLSLDNHPLPNDDYPDLSQIEAFK